MCCGKNITDKVKKIATIASGSVKAAVSSRPSLPAFIVRSLKIDIRLRQKRLAQCKACEKSTWMTKLDYAKWLLSHGITVLSHFEDLTGLPELPVDKNQTESKTLYCAVCKCWTSGKAEEKNEQCPLHKWESIT